jgi:hypothetical protein
MKPHSKLTLSLHQGDHEKRKTNTARREAIMVDETKLNQFIGRILGDLGGAFSVSLVRIGDRLGLYKALNANGPMTPGELATKTKIAERYAREWLSHQAASGYLSYDPASGRFTLPPEQAMVFALPDSPVYIGLKSRWL